MNNTELLELKDKLLFELDNVIYNFDDMMKTLKYIVECKYKNDVNNIKIIIQEFKKYFNDYDYKTFIFICIFFYKLEGYKGKTLFKNIDIYKYFLYHISESEYDILEDIVLNSFIKYLSGYEYYIYIFNHKLKPELKKYSKFIYRLKFNNSNKSKVSNYIYISHSNQEFIINYIKR